MGELVASVSEALMNLPTGRRVVISDVPFLTSDMTEHTVGPSQGERLTVMLSEHNVADTDREESRFISPEPRADTLVTYSAEMS